jgi:hypothetical protein
MHHTWPKAGLLLSLLGEWIRWCIDGCPSVEGKDMNLLWPPARKSCSASVSRVGQRMLASLCAGMCMTSRALAPEMHLVVIVVAVCWSCWSHSVSHLSRVSLLLSFMLSRLQSQVVRVLPYMLTVFCRGWCLAWLVVLRCRTGCQDGPERTPPAHETLPQYPYQPMCCRK